MSRAVINVATTDHTRKGQERIYQSASLFGAVDLRLSTEVPALSPTHTQIPYGFKSFALKHAAERGADTLLWCDACILPIRSLQPAWEKIERDGYLLMRNGYSNYEWTADSAYPDLFPGVPIEAARAVNRTIPHTVGGFFGLSMRHENGRAFLAELYRLASETRAFCGPWINSNAPGQDRRSPRCGPCGPADVHGHRHDQSAMSVIAWRLGMQLSDPPEYMVYGKAQDAQDPRTVVVADGDY